MRFDDRSPTARIHPATLWATRRVGFLLDEIRLRGETIELRDEATELARKYGIVTPYTAYLIVEDEERRNVPTAARSLQGMSADTAARDAAKAWAGFKDKKEGDDGVANARSQNFFKYAEQAGASIASGLNHESSRGFVAAAPAARAGVGADHAIHAAIEVRERPRLFPKRKTVGRYQRAKRDEAAARPVQLRRLFQSPQETS